MGLIVHARHRHSVLLMLFASAVTGCGGGSINSASGGGSEAPPERGVAAELRGKLFAPPKAVTDVSHRERAAVNMRERRYPHAAVSESALPGRRASANMRERLFSGSELVVDSHISLVQATAYDTAPPEGGEISADRRNAPDRLTVSFMETSSNPRRLPAVPRAENPLRSGATRDAAEFPVVELLDEPRGGFPIVETARPITGVQISGPDEGLAKDEDSASTAVPGDLSDSEDTDEIIAIADPDGNSLRPNESARPQSAAVPQVVFGDSTQEVSKAAESLIARPVEPLEVRFSSKPEFAASQDNRYASEAENPGVVPHRSVAAPTRDQSSPARDVVSPKITRLPPIEFASDAPLPAVTQPSTDSISEPRVAFAEVAHPLQRNAGQPALPESDVPRDVPAEPSIVPDAEPQVTFAEPTRPPIGNIAKSTTIGDVQAPTLAAPTSRPDREPSRATAGPSRPSMEIATNRANSEPAAPMPTLAVPTTRSNREPQIATAHAPHPPVRNIAESTRTSDAAPAPTLAATTSQPVQEPREEIVEPTRPLYENRTDPNPTSPLASVPVPTLAEQPTNPVFEPGVAFAEPTMPPHGSVSVQPPLAMSVPHFAVAQPRQVMPDNRPVDGLLLHATEARHHVQQGFGAANRGMLYTARKEFLRALQIVAEAKDAARGRRTHMDALSAGLTAIEEAERLRSASTTVADVNLSRLIGTHRTPVLQHKDVSEMLPLAVIDAYHEYAQQQLGNAVAGDPSGSMALYGLARVYEHLGSENGADRVARSRQSAAFHESAMFSCPDNYLAAHELGVVLTRLGRHEKALDMITRSIQIAPTSVAYHNLATVSRQIGQNQMATTAEQYAAEMAQREGTSADMGPYQVALLDPAEFARTSERVTSAQTAVLGAGNAAAEGATTTVVGFPEPKPSFVDRLAAPLKALSPQSWGESTRE